MKNAERESFRYCDETCPDVDNAADDAIKTLKDDITDVIRGMVDEIKDNGTRKLRRALVEVIEEKQRLEEEVEELQRSVEYRDDEIAELKLELNELRAEA